MKRENYHEAGCACQYWVVVWEVFCPPLRQRDGYMVDDGLVASLLFLPPPRRSSSRMREVSVLVAFACRDVAQCLRLFVPALYCRELPFRAECAVVLQL